MSSGISSLFLLLIFDFGFENLDGSNSFLLFGSELVLISLCLFGGLDGVDLEGLD